MNQQIPTSPIENNVHSVARLVATTSFLGALLTVSMTNGPFRISSYQITFSDLLLLISALSAIFCGYSIPKYTGWVVFALFGAIFYAIGLIITSFYTYPQTDIVISAAKYLAATTIACLLSAYILNSEGKIEAAINVTLIGAAVNSAFSLIQMTTGQSFFFETPNFWGRYTGFSEHPNELGPFSAIFSSIAIYMCSQSKGKRAIFYLAIALAISIGIFTSSSMSAAGGLVVGLTLTLAITRQFTKAIIGVMVVALLAFVAITFVMPNLPQGQNSLISRLDDLTSSGSSYTTAASRLDVYSIAWDQISKNPFIGHPQGELPHNFVIFSWWHGGIPSLLGGLAFVFGMTFAAVNSKRRTEKENSTILNALLVGAIVLVFEISLSPPAVRRSTWMEYWLVAAAACTFRPQTMSRKRQWRQYIGPDQRKDFQGISISATRIDSHQR